MADTAIPANLVPSGSTPAFDQKTAPNALQEEHKLAEGTWGLLRVLQGQLIFVDLESLEETTIVADGQITIRPGAPHRVALDGPVQFRIDFYREPHP